MGKKILALSLVLVLALGFVACDGEAAPTAQEIVDNATQALDSISSYQFELTMNMDVTGESEGENFEGNVATDYSGALDLENRKMKIAVTMDTSRTGTEDTHLSNETYFVGDWMYTTTDIPDMGITWIKTVIPAGYWQQMNQVESQLEILGTSQIEVVGSETVGGVDCYVLEVTLDLEELWTLFMQQIGVTSDLMPDIAPELLDEIFQSYSAKQWVAKDSYFIMKVEIVMAMELTPQLMGIPEGEGEASLDVVMTMLVHDYNQSLSIELPPGAEDVIEMPGF
jgi:hypothetical protein